MESFIAQYGLLAVFIGAAVEGDMVLILSGVAAHLGLLHFPTALAVGWSGALCADCVCYALGRYHAVAAQRTQAYRMLAPRIMLVVDRLGAAEVVIARFIIGTRVVSMLYWGIRRLPFARFLLLDVVGCAVWATTLASLGYAFSGSAAALVGEVKRVEVWLLIAVVLATCATVVARQLLCRALPQGKG